MASSMYCWRSITTTADPLSAGLMMMSTLFLREERAWRSSRGRLSCGLMSGVSVE